MASQFEKILNFRDVGQYINQTTGEQLLRPGLLYRSARPDAATSSDRERLLSELKVKTIIDLRTPTEHVEQSRKHASVKVPTAPAATPSDPQRPLRITGIEYKDVNFNGSSYSSALIKQLSYGQMAKLFSLYAIGYRKEAISVLGTNVMAKRGLSGLAEDSLTHCTAEVKAVFDVLSHEASYPLVVHCTQGKDRTGLVVLLVLLLLDVPVQAIEQDYRLSESELVPEKEEKLKEIRSIGLPDSFADCPADWVETVCDYIDQQYGGVEKYLAVRGISVQQQNGIKQILARM